MNNESSATETARVLVVGRSPSVLRTAVQLLRAKGQWSWRFLSRNLACRGPILW
jgi:hypothetical protein